MQVYSLLSNLCCENTNKVLKMDGINFPEFINTEEKYNKLIHEGNTLPKFEEIFLKLLSDDNLEMSTILVLMKLIEHDVILVNNLTEASNLMEMTESFIRYIMLKESTSPKKTKQQESEKKTKNSIKDVSKRSKKSTKEEDSRKDKKMKPAVAEESEIVCDCDC